MTSQNNEGDMPSERYKEAIKLYNPQNASNATIKDTFVIRLKEFNKIWKDIKSAEMLRPEQHYVIQGIRGSGKSTLLTRLAIEVEEHQTLSKWLIPILFREEEYGINSLFAFWEHIAEELTEHLVYADQFIGLSDEIEQFENNPKAAFKLLDSYLIKANKKIILFIDNIAELFEIYSENEEAMLGEVLSQNNNIRIIGGSAISLEHFYDSKAPFYQIFHIITLQEINQQETSRLLLKLGKYFGNEEEKKIKQLIDEEPEKIETLRRLTGGIPRTIVLFFHILIEGPSGSAFQYLEDTLDKVSPIYKHRMDDLSKQQKPIVHAIAKNWDAISAKEIAKNTRIDSKQVSAQLNQLQKQWLIEKIPTSTKNHMYTLQERFFNIWYLMRYGRRKDRNKLIWLTRFFEIWCSKDQLTERARLFHQSLLQNPDPRGAMIYATALINSDNLKITEKEQVYNKTRSHLERTGYSELAKELPIISPDQYLQQGVQLLKSGTFNEAETYIRKSIEARIHKAIEANNMPIRLAGTKMYSNLGNLLKERKHNDNNNDTEANYKLAIEHNDSDAYNDLGVLFLERKQYDDAEANFKLAIEHGNTDAYNNLGNLSKERKQYDDAEAYYKLAIEHGNTAAYNNLGNLLFLEREQYDDAAANYKLAIQHGDTGAHLMLGILSHTCKQYDDAEANYKLAIEHGNTAAYNNLGSLFKERNQYDNAETSFKLATQHGYTDAYRNLGELCKERKQYEDAEANFKLAIEHGNTEAYLNLGILFREHKQYDDAEANYKLAIQHGNTDACLDLAYLFLKRQQYDKAESSYRQAIDLGVIGADIMLARLYVETAQTNKKAKALSLALGAVKNYPNNFASLHTLASVALWTSEFDIAQDSIEKILSTECWQQDIGNEKNFIDLLIQLLAKDQINLFDKWQQQYDLADKLKPLYYAFLNLVPEKYPNELLRMGSELKETVDEILDKIALYKE